MGELPSNLKMASVDAVKSRTIGEEMADNSRIGPAIKVAILSAWLKAIRLGTNSPTTTDKYVMPMTTAPSAIVLLYGSMAGIPAK